MFVLGGSALLVWCSGSHFSSADAGFPWAHRMPPPRQDEQHLLNISRRGCRGQHWWSILVINTGWHMGLTFDKQFNFFQILNSHLCLKGFNNYNYLEWLSLEYIHTHNSLLKKTHLNSLDLDQIKHKYQSPIHTELFSSRSMNYAAKSRKMLKN